MIKNYNLKIYDCFIYSQMIPLILTSNIILRCNIQLANINNLKQNNTNNVSEYTKYKDIVKMFLFLN